MNKEGYEFRKLQDKVYEFDSITTNETITITLVFQETQYENFYNIVFGIFDYTNNQINDLETINHSDIKNLFKTIIEIVIQFTNQNPQYSVLFVGSTPARTRLYRIVLATLKDIVIEKFELYGIYNKELVNFELIRQYEGFVIKKRDDKK